MEATIEKEEKTESRYLISRDDRQIEWEVGQLKEGAKHLNDLTRYMREFTEFPLVNSLWVKDCIKMGPTLFIREATIARTDKESLKKLYGFEADREALLNMVPVSHIPHLDKAEKLAESLRDESINNYNFEEGTGHCTVKPEAIRRITNQYTRYASKKEAELHKRIDALKAEVDAIKQECGFDPLTVVEYKERTNPFVVLYRLEKNTEGITEYCIGKSVKHYQTGNA